MRFDRVKRLTNQDHVGHKTCMSPVYIPLGFGLTRNKISCPYAHILPDEADSVSVGAVPVAVIHNEVVNVVVSMSIMLVQKPINTDN